MQKNCVFNVLKKGKKRKLIHIAKNTNNQTNYVDYRELIDEKREKKTQTQESQQKEAARRTNHKRWSIVTTHLTKGSPFFKRFFFLL